MVHYTLVIISDLRCYASTFSSTLKALANSGPGLRFHNPGTTHLISRTRDADVAASSS